MANTSLLNAMLNASKKMNQNGNASNASNDEKSKELSPRDTNINVARQIAPSSKALGNSYSPSDYRYSPGRHTSEVPYYTLSNVSRDLSTKYTGLSKTMYGQAAQEAQENIIRDTLTKVPQSEEEQPQQEIPIALSSESETERGRRRYNEALQGLINPIADGDSGRLITPLTDADRQVHADQLARQEAEQQEAAKGGTISGFTAENIGNTLKGIATNPIGYAAAATDYAANGVARALANIADFALGFFNSANKPNYPTLLDFSEVSPLAPEGTADSTEIKNNLPKFISNAKSMLDNFNAAQRRYYLSGDSVTSKFDNTIGAATDEKHAELNENAVNRAINDLASSIGYMVPAQLANLVMPGSGLALLFTSGYSDGYSTAVSEGASGADATNYAILNGLNQSLGELLVGGVVGKGAGALDSLSKAAVKNIPLLQSTAKKLSAAIGNSTLKSAADVIAKRIGSSNIRAAASTFLTAVGEGVEEVGQGGIDAWAKSVTYDPDALSNLDVNELAYEGFIGSFMGGFYGGLNFSSAVADAETRQQAQEQAAKIAAEMQNAASYASTPASVQATEETLDKIIEELQTQKEKYEEIAKKGGEGAADALSALDAINSTLNSYNNVKQTVIQNIPNILLKNNNSHTAELERIAFLTNINEQAKAGNLTAAADALEQAVQKNNDIIITILDSDDYKAPGGREKYASLIETLQNDSQVYNTLLSKARNGSYNADTIDSVIKRQTEAAQRAADADKNTIVALLPERASPASYPQQTAEDDRSTRPVLLGQNNQSELLRRYLGLGTDAQSTPSASASQSTQTALNSQNTQAEAASESQSTQPLLLPQYTATMSNSVAASILNDVDLYSAFVELTGESPTGDSFAKRRRSVKEIAQRYAKELIPVRAAGEVLESGDREGAIKILTDAVAAKEAEIERIRNEKKLAKAQKAARMRAAARERARLIKANEEIRNAIATGGVIHLPTATQTTLEANPELSQATPASTPARTVSNTAAAATQNTNVDAQTVAETVQAATQANVQDAQNVQGAQAAQSAAPADIGASLPNAQNADVAAQGARGNASSGTQTTATAQITAATAQQPAAAPTTSENTTVTTAAAGTQPTSAAANTQQEAADEIPPASTFAKQTEKLLLDDGYTVWEKNGRRRIYVNDLTRYLDRTGDDEYNGVKLYPTNMKMFDRYVSSGGRTRDISIYFDCNLKKWQISHNGLPQADEFLEDIVDRFVYDLVRESEQEAATAASTPAPADTASGEQQQSAPTTPDAVTENAADVPAQAALPEQSTTPAAADTAQSEIEATPSPAATVEAQAQTTDTETDTTDTETHTLDTESDTLDTESDTTDTNADTDAIGAASDAVSDYVYNCIRDKIKITRTEITKIAQRAAGTTLAQGKLTVKDINDAMELGLNRFILDMDMDSREYSVTGMMFLQGRLPTQTSRSAEQEQMQQFSTPPAIAFTAAYAANVNASDVVLEPSAGIGGIAVFAKKEGAEVYVNELSDRRRALLETLEFDGVFGENAEQIDNILSGIIKPSVIVMNPPFSSSASRNVKDNKIGAQHVEAALRLLGDGGRLVAITGRGMNDSAASYRSWWKDIKSKYNVRANISLSGKNYSKFGTSFDIQMIVIDKTGATTDKVITGSVEKVEQLYEMLEGVHDDRTGTQGVREAQTRVHKEAKRVTSRTEDTQNSSRREAVHEVGADKRGERVESVSRSSGVQGDGERGVGVRGRPGNTEQNGGITGERTAEHDVLLPGRSDGRGGVDGERGISRGGDNRQGVAGSRAGVYDEVSGRQLNTDTEAQAEAQTAAQKPKKQPGTAAKPKSQAGADTTQSVAKAAASEIKLSPDAKRKKVVRKELSDSMFDTYTPSKLAISGAKAHPSKIAESAAMSAVEPPDITYVPNLPRTLIEKGALSDVQLEAISYAGQANDTMLSDGTRRAFFIGDGTGVGKGREIAGIILDNFRNGRKKAIWVSKNKALLPDCKRDMQSIHGNDKMVTLFEGGKKADAALTKDEGVIFATYNTLSKGYSSDDGNLSKLVSWFGEDYDGVIIFDESHAMANSKSKTGSRGRTKPSDIALSGIELQKRLPNARIIYSSATGATEVSNLAYAQRLGLWGEGTTFADSSDFVGKIEKGGIAAMEVVARSMKAMGVYVSRNLSYDGVTYRPLEHKLSAAQRSQYNACADAWATIAQNTAAAIATTSADSKARGAANSALWSAQQRFFNQVITSMQVPGMIADIDRQLKNGNSAVIQLTSTNEASTARALAEAARNNDENLDDFDSSPRQLVQEYLEKSFPVKQYEEFINDNGERESRPVVDSAGNHVENAEAVAARDALIAQLSDLKIADSPLDLIISHFGTDMVAENTGRKKRVIIDKDGTRRVEKLPANKDGDVSAFQNGDKRIMIFSEAGGTGKSYHADRGAKNQQRRVHYLLQAGWRADAAVQGFGRSHRSNEANTPEFVLVQTDVVAQKRFISTIARRLDQLGALTKGQRDTGSQGIFKASDNLENEYASAALVNTIRRLVQTDQDALTRMGLGSMINPNGSMSDSAKSLQIGTFLNRLFMLNVDKQTEVFDIFDTFLQNSIEQAQENGTYDSGMQNYRADRVVTEDVQEIDNPNGAKTQYYRLTAYNKTVPVTFDEIDTGGSKFMGFYQNTRSDNIYAAYEAGDVTDARTGAIRKSVRLMGQTASRGRRVSKNDLLGNRNIIKISDEKQARKIWDENVAALPPETSHTLHLIGGEMLSIWDKLPEDNMRINRVLLEDGSVVIGRIIPESKIDETLRRINITAAKTEITGKKAETALNSGGRIALSNGWTIARRRVAGEWRVELLGMSLSDYYALKDRYNIIYERDGSYKNHYYLPNDSSLTSRLDRLFNSYPPDSITSGSGGDTAFARRGARSDADANAANADDAEREAAEKLWRAQQRNSSANQSDATKKSKSESIKSISNIIEQIRRDFDIPVSRGGFDTKKADAIYKKRAQSIRVALENDLPSITHELGHHVDNQLELSSLDSIDEVVAKLPRNFAKEYSAEELPGEAVGEFVREYLTDKQAAQNKYPEFYKDFTAALDTKNITDPKQKASIDHMRSSLDALADDINAYMSAAPAEQYRAAQSTSRQRNSESKNPITAAQAQWKKTYRAIVDSLDPINDVVKYSRDNLGALWVKGERDPYVLATNALNVKSVTAYCIEHDVVDMNGIVIGPSLMKSLEGLDATEVSEFSRYLMLRHALEWVDAEDKGAYKRVFANIALENPTLIKSEIAALEKEHKTFKDTAQKVYDYQQNVLNAYCVKGGAISEETAEMLQQRYPCYVPFQRNITGKTRAMLPKTAFGIKNQSSPIKNASGNGSSRKIASQSSPIKKAKGSGAEMINVIESIVNNTQRMVSFGYRNRAMQALADMADEIEGIGSIIERLSPESDPEIKAELDSIESLDEADNAGEYNEKLDKTIGNFETGYNPAKFSGKSVVSVMRDGKKQYYEVHDDALLKSILDMTPKQIDGIRNLSRMMLNVTKVLTTSANLTFSITNPIRDIQTAWKLGDNNNPITFAVSYVKAVSEVIRKSDDFKRMRAMGVGYGKYSADLDVIRRSLHSLNRINENKAAGVVRKVFMHPIQTLADVIAVPESVPRLMEFKRVLKSTDDVQQAAYSANDITTNFSRSGDKGRVLNDIFLFSNAAVQGVDRLARAFKSDNTKEGNAARNKRIGKMIITDLLIAAVQLFFNYQDDEGKEAYHNLSNYMKNNYYNFYTGDGMFVRIPKARENAILGSFIERCCDYIIGSDEQAFADFGGYVATNIIPPFLPSDASGYGFAEKSITALHSVAGNSALGGFVDIAMNRNYQGVPIVSKSNENLPNNEQYSPTTSKLAYWIANAVDSSPLQIDYLIDNYTGYIGSFLSSAFPMDDSRRAETLIGALGFKDRFTADSAYSTDVFNRIYDTREKAEREYQKTGTGEAALANEKAQFAASFVSQAMKSISAHSTPAEQREQRMQLQALLNDSAYQVDPFEQYLIDNFDGEKDVFINSAIDSKLEMTVNGVKMEYTLPFDEFVAMNATYKEMLDAVRLDCMQRGADPTLLADAYTKLRKQLRDYYKRVHAQDFVPAG